MADQRAGGIAWTDESWNPIRGCSKVSAGCTNCYAESVAARFSGPGLPYEGLAKDGRWTGKVVLVEKHLADPLRWTRPRRVFVNSMSDLFHESLDDATIDRVFGVMALCDGTRGKYKRHDFQVLTKRPARARAYLSDPETPFRIASEVCHRLTAVGWRPWRGGLDWRTWEPWPLPNVWLGVSVEDQATADERIPLLLEAPAAIRFVSAEPLLGAVDLSAEYLTKMMGRYPFPSLSAKHRTRIVHLLDWVIVGGESGPGARPCNVEWIRALVEQCREAGVPAFVKQLGARPIFDRDDMTDPQFRDLDASEEGYTHGPVVMPMLDRKGGDIAEFPEDLRIREFPNVTR